MNEKLELLIASKTKIFKNFIKKNKLKDYDVILDRGILLFVKEFPKGLPVQEFTRNSTIYKSKTPICVLKGVGIRLDINSIDLHVNILKGTHPNVNTYDTNRYEYSCAGTLGSASVDFSKPTEVFDILNQGIAMYSRAHLNSCYAMDTHTKNKWIENAVGSKRYATTRWLKKVV